MDKCGDTPITETDVARATTDIHSAFEHLQEHGLLPTDATLTIQPGALGKANVNTTTGNVTIDPYVMSCLDTQQILGVMAHEAGHYNRPNLDDAAVLHAAGQLALIAGIVAVTGIRMIKFVGFRLAGHRRDPWKNDAPIIRSLLVAHTLNGMGLASAHKQEELAADSFAVQVLNDPEPVATMFTALDEFKDDPFSGSPTRADPITAGEIASGIGISFLAYGYVGPLMTHPGDEDRAANARATPLTGMPAPRPVENPQP